MRAGIPRSLQMPTARLWTPSPSPDNMWLRVRSFSNWRIPAPAKLRSIASRAEASLYGDTTVVRVHLRQLSDAADPLTRTFEARYVLEGSAARAPLGVTVTVYLSSSAPSADMSVPLGAIDDE